MPIHQTLKKIRERKNLSQKYIADKLHVSQNTYSAIETGKTKIDENRIYQLADILEVPFTELMTDTETSFTFNDKIENLCATHIQTFNAGNKYLIELLKAELNIKNEQIAMLHRLLEKGKSF